MSKCNCKLCRFGERLQKIVDDYKLSQIDKSFLLNDVFGVYEQCLKFEAENTALNKAIDEIYDTASEAMAVYSEKGDNK